MHSARFAYNTVPMRLILTLFAIHLVIACGPKQHQLAFNRYVIQSPYSEFIPYAHAISDLELQANKKCTAGYRKIHDFDTKIKGKKILIWEIMCKGVNRAEDGNRTILPDSNAF